MTYLVALTPAVSKISNFIYPTVPVLYLLIAVTIVNLWRSASEIITFSRAAPWF